MTSLQDALDSAYRYLGHRDRTVAEVRAHLVDRKLVAEAIADEAIEELRRQNYLDDARFARRFSEDRRALDSWGGERIERRLLELGVEPDVVATSIAVHTRDGELEAATALLERRFGRSLRDERDRQRALGVLVRKGYELDLAYEAVRRHA